MSDLNVSQHANQEFWSNQKEQEREGLQRNKESINKEHAQADVKTNESAAQKGSSSQTTESSPGTGASKANAGTQKSTQEAFVSTLQQAEADNPLLNSTTSNFVSQTASQVGAFDRPILDTPSENGVEPNLNPKDFVKTLEVGLNQFLTPSPKESSLAATPPVHSSIPVTDPAIIAYASAQNMTPEEAQAQIQAGHATSFKISLTNHDLPVKDFKLLLYAYNNPDAVKNLPKHLQKIFGQAMAGANAMARDVYNLPTGWQMGKTAFSSELETRVTRSFDQHFENQVDKLVESGKLTKDEAIQLRAMHYAPEGAFSEAPPQLERLFQKLQQKATEETRKEYGAGAELQPKTDTEYYTSMLDAKFVSSFLKAMDEAKPKLSEEMKQQILKAYANPTAAGIPEQVLAFVEKFKNLSLAELKAVLGLPDEWMPPAKITSKAPTGAYAKLLKTAENGKAMAENMTSKAEKLLQEKGLANTPENFLLKNFYSTVLNALSKLSEKLYYLEVQDSLIAKVMSHAKTDTELNRCEMRKKQLEEMRNQEPKLTGFLKVFVFLITAIVMLVMTILTAGLLGPLLWTVFTLYIVDGSQQMAGEEGVLQQLFKKLSEAFGDGGGFINLLLAILMGGTNIMMTIDLVFQKSNAIQDIAMACGASKETAAIINMAIMMAVMVAIIIVTIIFFPLIGELIAPMIAKITSMIAEFLTQALQAIGASLQLARAVAETIAKFLPATLELVTQGLQMAQNVVNIINETKQAALALLQAHLQASMEEMAALIALLKKLIQAIMLAMQGSVDWIQSINKQVAGMFNRASAQTTQLSQAL